MREHLGTDDHGGGTNRVSAGFEKGDDASVGQGSMRAVLGRDGRGIVVASTADRMPDHRPGKVVIRRPDRAGRPDRASPMRTVRTGITTSMGFDVALDPAGRLRLAGAAFRDYPSKGVLLIGFRTRSRSGRVGPAGLAPGGLTGSRPLRRAGRTWRW